MRSPTHQAALEYAQRGWFVFPCVAGGKTPLPGTRGHLDATVDPAQIDRIWGANPNLNVGIAVAPSGLIVLDVDVSEYEYTDKATGEKKKARKRGRESLARIESELAPTLLAGTGREGIHAVYTRPPDIEPHRHIGIIEKDSGLDLIGEGYIVAAPSYLAETGRYYQWTQLHNIAPLPPFLQAVTKAPRIQEKVSELGTAIVEGGRNNALFRLGCALRDTGISREALARALDFENHARFTPPLPDPEVALIIDSVMTRVQVTRDVAAAAVVEQEIQAIFAPAAKEDWLENVALVPQPPVLFYSTGFPELDRLTGGGFSTRHLAGIIGPPSTGKSALVGEWLIGLAKQRPVLHCSLELMKPELFVRYAAHEMKFPWRDGIKGAVPQQDMARAVKGMRIKVMGADDFDRMDPFGSLEAAVARMTQECGIAPIVAIDYIQIMARGASTEMRHKVGELTYRARQLAQRFDTVVLGVFTTQRDKYSLKQVEIMRAAQDPRAYLGAAKESGDIEFDCAILMYLDVDMSTQGPEKPAQLALARCRVGDEGFVGLRVRLDVGSFKEDMGALSDFANEARQQKRADDDMKSACDAVLEAVRALPGQPWGTMQARAAAKSSRSVVDRARDKLIGDNVIERCDRFDENHRKAKGFTLRIREQNPAQTVPSEEGEP